MKLRRKIAILLALLLLLSLPLITTAFADLGDLSGGSDFGGGSSSGDDCDGIASIFYLILRIGCVAGECAESAGCSHGQVILFEIVFFAAAIGLLALIVRLRSKAGSDKAPVSGAPVQRAVPPTQNAFSKLRETDPEFSEEDLKEKLRNLYYRLTDCRQTGDLSPIRPYLSDALFARTQAELDAFKTAHVTERTERLAILDAQLLGYARQNDTDVIFAKLATRCVRYQQNAETGAVVSGSAAQERFETVHLELTRASGEKTEAREAGRSAKNCPFCGAPLSLNESNVCPYCDSVLPADRGEWVIRSITVR